MKYRTTALFLLSACSAYSCSSSDGQRASADSANPSDDHGNTAATATLVLAGTAAAGNIEVSDDADWFKFQATASHVYRFRLQRKTLPLRDGHAFIVDTDQKTEIKNASHEVTLTFRRPAPTSCGFKTQEDLPQAPAPTNFISTISVPMTMRTASKTRPSWASTCQPMAPSSTNPTRIGFASQLRRARSTPWS